MSHNLKYLLDGEPVTANELIDKACALDAEYCAQDLYLTSEAAAVLRKHGCSVADNPAWELKP